MQRQTKIRRPTKGGGCAPWELGGGCLRLLIRIVPNQLLFNIR